MHQAMKTHPLATTSLALAIFSVCCGLTIIPSIILGYVAIDQIKKHPERYTGAKTAKAGIIIGYIFALICFWGLIFKIFGF